MSSIDPTTFFDECQYGKLIELTHGYYAIVDEEDYERISQFRWYVFKSRRCFYAKRTVYGKETGKFSTVCMHHDVLKSKSLTDHINTNGLDNRKKNLRHCTISQNCENKRKSLKKMSSRFKGVSRVDTLGTGSVRWRALIQKDRLKHLGYFDTEEDAALAYDREARILFGEFARTNFDTDDGRVLVRAFKEKLNDDQVDQIRDMIAKGVSYKEISETFGVSISWVSAIKVGRARRQRSK